MFSLFSFFNMSRVRARFSAPDVYSVSVPAKKESDRTLQGPSRHLNFRRGARAHDDNLHCAPLAPPLALSLALSIQNPLVYVFALCLYCVSALVGGPTSDPTPSPSVGPGLRPSDGGPPGPGHGLASGGPAASPPSQSSSVLSPVKAHLTVSDLR